MRYIQNEAEIQAVFMAFTALQINFGPFYTCMYTVTIKSEMPKKILW